MTTIEYRNVGGNFFDKYNTRNCLARRLMQGFFAAFDSLVTREEPETAFEVGCGEGYLSLRMLERNIDAHGFDLEPEIVAQANTKSEAAGYGTRFETKSLYDLKTAEIETNLIVCCEVLEHLPDPRAALTILASQRSQGFIFSVPREPVWRLLNMARGKYLGAFGNTPGHLQHWSSQGFLREIGQHFHPVAVLKPLPWTMVLARPLRTSSCRAVERSA